MKNSKLVLKISFLFLLSSLCFISCGKDKIMGYSVVLWNIPEYKLQAGDVVPVYIRSNISHMYVAGVHKEDGSIEKIETPLWMLTDPLSKSKVVPVQKKYNEFSHTYASVKVDGLPCRAEAVNTSKQVYRFRKGEIIKILYKGKGQIPMSGSKPLPGDWYRVLTDNGTQGWCFSYSLTMFETDENGKKIGDEEIEEIETTDQYIEAILDKTFYPDNFKTMIDAGNIDLNVINASYNFRIDTETNKVILNLSDIHESWDYNGYTKTDDREYTLKDVPLKVFYKKSNYVVVRYTGSSGKPQDLDFVLIDDNIADIIQAEKDRRVEELDAVIEYGPKFTSTNYGTITFTEEGTFRWNNFKLLVPTVISANAKTTGTVSVKYAVSKALKANYDGVITFNFTGMSDEVNFLYKFENGGMRLEDATEATFKGNLITGRSSSPMIMYFKVN